MYSISKKLMTGKLENMYKKFVIMAKYYFVHIYAEG